MCINPLLWNTVLRKPRMCFVLCIFLYFLLVCFSLNHSHVPFVQNLWEDGFTLLFLLSGT